LERRLAAILAADIVGYSKLMQQDEAGTLAALKAMRTQFIEPLVCEHSGRIVKLMGDGFLVEFRSVVDAVNCALAWQGGNSETVNGTPLVFRIGINLGDIVIDDDDTYGEGVNIAARLEPLARPGGICVSAIVHDQVKGKVEVGFEDMGDQHLKNIDEPVRAYRAGQRPEGSGSGAVSPSRSDEPTIAVLPFNNMSVDEEQEYFSDGITEDIITALSKYRWLKVVARNTTFGFKGQSPNIAELSRQLGADYVVEGSVRKAGGRVRITAQLIDAGTGSHIWAERYDRDLDDIFAVQDEITETIVGRVEPELGMVERQRVAHKPRSNLKAWDCYHLGVANFYKFSADANRRAQELFKKSSELDPAFGDAYAWWAYATVLGMVYFDDEPDQDILDQALQSALKAVEIDDRNAVFYMLLARVRLARCEYEPALAELQTAINLNPTFAAAYCGLGDSLAYEGRLDESIPLFEKAIRLSPHDPQRWAFYSYGALSFIFNSEFEQAVTWAKNALQVPNCQYWANAHLTAALAHLDRSAEASDAVAQLLAKKADFSCAFAKKKLFYIKRPEQLDLYLDGLRKAGVPED
jgi:TolB-like protein/Tfp pilus assembly protein PilF